MTTAPENRGGLRPTAPQNNPANVSGTGGAGQSGQYKGFAYGQNKALAEQMAGAPLQGTANSPTPTGVPTPQLPEVTQITAPTENPDQHVMDGASMGPGATSVPGLPAQPDNTKFDQLMQQYRPVLDFIASRPETSTDTRDALNKLMNGNS
jgi:hypothetical protein